MSKLDSMLRTGPVFCFGSDTDWNSDDCVELLVDGFAEQQSKLTVFATHKAGVLARNPAHIQVAVHPNFLPGSTHGATVDEVIQHIFSLFPAAQTYRSHSYFDNQYITEKMAKRGIGYDANLCLYRQAELKPLRHCHIDWRFPSWLDDNIHWYHQGSWRFADLQSELERPGLKLINLHPIAYAMNLSSIAACQRWRSHFTNADRAFIDKHREPGHGPYTFLNDLLQWLAGRHPTYHLSELHDLQNESETISIDPRLVTPPDRPDVKGRPAIGGGYAEANDQERAELVQAQYNAFRERGKYATSRDYNNREIEIDAIGRHVVDGSVLDLGCGNGYTLLSLGQEKKPRRMVGVDFSRTMIDDANDMMNGEFSRSLFARPEFICSDVSAYLDTIEPGEFNTIISERLVVNLASWDAQRHLIEGIISRLPVGGRYLMVEGTAQGFGALNVLRRHCGLNEIPDRYPGNESSNKLDEEKLDEVFSTRSDLVVRARHLFSFYSLASKVLHPLIVSPDEPRFGSPINDHARAVQQAMTEAGIELPNIGAAKMWVIEKR